MTAIWIVQVLEVDRSSDPDGSCRMRLRLIRDYPDAVLPQSFHFFVLRCIIKDRHGSPLQIKHALESSIAR